MKTKVFLTSLLAITVVGPVFADPESATWPTNGLMQANKKYTNAATYANLGTYEGPVTATATWAFSVPAGKYLPKNVNSVSGLAYCPDGSYCPGNTTDGYLTSTTADQGKVACPSPYVKSGTGAKSEDDCYEDWSGRACENTPAGATGCVYTVGARKYKNGRTANMGMELVCQAGYTQPFVSLFEKVGLGVDATSGAAKSDRPGFEKEFGGASASDVSGNHWVLNYNVTDYGNVKVNGSARCAYDSEAPSDTITGAAANFSGGSMAGSAGAITLFDDQEMDSVSAYENGYHCFCKIDSVSVNSGTPIEYGSKWAYYGYIRKDIDMDTNCYALCPQKCLETLKNTNINPNKYLREALFANTPIVVVE